MNSVIILRKIILPFKEQFTNCGMDAVMSCVGFAAQQYVNREFPDVQLVLEKAEEPEIKLPASAGSWKKQESSRKTSISALLTMPKPLTV